MAPLYNILPDSDISNFEKIVANYGHIWCSNWKYVDQTESCGHKPEV